MAEAHSATGEPGKKGYEMIKNRKSNGLLLLLLSAVLTLLLLGASAQQAHGAVYNGKYWLKVNKQASVITAYRRTNGRWKPVRAMLTSTGAPSMPTKGRELPSRRLFSHVLDERVLLLTPSITKYTFLPT